MERVQDGVLRTSPEMVHSRLYALHSALLEGNLSLIFRGLIRPSGDSAIDIHGNLEQCQYLLL
jgi:hypothetical protein